MDQFKWIMSDGGALICMEIKFQNSWGGILGLSVEDVDANNDYDRSSKVYNYIEKISLKQGDALIFGEGPLDTSFWRSPSKQVYLMRACYCEESTDFDAIMRALQPQVFDNPAEMIEFTIGSAELVLFDSAHEGTRVADEFVSSSIEPGHYRILTQTYEPDSESSFILHRFDRIS